MSAPWQTKLASGERWDANGSKGETDTAETGRKMEGGQGGDEGHVQAAGEEEHRAGQDKAIWEEEEMTMMEDRKAREGRSLLGADEEEG